MAACILINFRLHPLDYYLHLCKLVRTTIYMKIVGRTNSLPLIICNSSVFSTNVYGLVWWFTFLWLEMRDKKQGNAERRLGVSHTFSISNICNIHEKVATQMCVICIVFAKNSELFGSAGLFWDKLYFKAPPTPPS